MKIRKDPSFHYDEEYIKLLEESVSRGEERQHRLRSAEATATTLSVEIHPIPCNVSPQVETTSFGKSVANESLEDCSDIYFMPFDSNCVQNITQQDDSNSPVKLRGSLSQELKQEPEDRRQEGDLSLVNKHSDPSDIERQDITTFRRNSSTRLDFLNINTHILSVSSSVCTDMSTNEGSSIPEACECGKSDCGSCNPTGNSGAHATDTADESQEQIGVSDQEITETMAQASNRIQELCMQVKTLEKIVTSQHQTIEALRESGNDASGTDRSRSQRKTKEGKNKKVRVEIEKERTLRVLQSSIRGETMKSNDTTAESDGYSSEDGVNMKAMKKKMTAVQRERCNKRTASRLEQAGAMFPEDDYETSDSSGNESCNFKNKCRHSRQVKSGSKVKKRPVKRTELWPHTLANEEETEEVTHENISLAKFYTCFTSIMLDCDRGQSRGRSSLLHAISLVLECLFWPDARAFHNIVMHKIEQGKIDWASDFESLAEDFIDKKVRLSFKSKGSSGSNSYRSGSNYNGGYSNNNRKGFSKGTGYTDRRATGKNSSVYNSVCRQYNFGTCKYGTKCFRWHVCWTCAEAGKPGEFHQALTHNNSSSTKSKQGEPRS